MCTIELSFYGLHNADRMLFFNDSLILKQIGIFVRNLLVILSFRTFGAESGNMFSFPSLIFFSSCQVTAADIMVTLVSLVRIETIFSDLCKYALLNTSNIEKTRFDKVTYRTKGNI